MNIYMAPMEGITGYVYRNAHHRFYGGVDRYFAPFIVARAAGGWTSREKNDVHPSHNPEIPLVPQIMANEAHAFTGVAEKLYDQGYPEVNFNLGCPSGTVVAKNKGCGFLKDRENLDRFFDQVFEALAASRAKDLKVSVKARLGCDSAEELPPLLEIYNRYPISELILHARIRKDYYQGPLDLDSFAYACKNAVAPLCYNGDIYTVTDYEKMQTRFPDVSRFMLGRGILADPALPEKIRGISRPEAEEKARLLAFHDELVEGYRVIMSGDRNVLFKMKELWSYMTPMFSDSAKAGKQIKKAGSMADYQSAVREMFSHPLTNALIGGESRFSHGDRFKI